MPGLVLIDGGLGQLHAAADALEAIGIINQPLASIAKREEMIYVLGQEDEPIVLDRFSPILHLIQIDSRRSASVRGDVPPHAAQRAAADLGAGQDSRRGREDGAEAAEALSAAWSWCVRRSEACAGRPDRARGGAARAE